jgi:hypothetical protein
LDQVRGNFPQNKNAIPSWSNFILVFAISWQILFVLPWQFNSLVEEYLGTFVNSPFPQLSLIFFSLPQPTFFFFPGLSWGFLNFRSQSTDIIIIIIGRAG